MAECNVPFYRLPKFYNEVFGSDKSAKEIFTIIIDHLSQKYPYMCSTGSYFVELTNAAMARESYMSLPTVKRALKTLETMGLIAIVHETKNGADVRSIVVKDVRILTAFGFTKALEFLDSFDETAYVKTDSKKEATKQFYENLNCTDAADFYTFSALAGNIPQANKEFMFAWNYWMVKRFGMYGNYSGQMYNMLITRYMQNLNQPYDYSRLERFFSTFKMGNITIYKAFKAFDKKQSVSEVPPPMSFSNFCAKHNINTIDLDNSLKVV
jgi:Fe2+ or Zn2+ uptake regulation protein